MERTFEGLVRRKGSEAGLEVDCLGPLDAAGTAGWARLASLTAGGGTRGLPHRAMSRKVILRKVIRTVIYRMSRPR
jgi:hypothetical protein